MKRRKLLCSGVAMLLSAMVLTLTATAEETPTTQDQWELRDEPGTVTATDAGVELTTPEKVSGFAYTVPLTGEFTVSVDVTFPEDDSDGSLAPYAYVSLRNVQNNTWFLPRIFNSNGKINYDAATLPDKKDWIHVVNQGVWIEGTGQTVTVTFAHKADADTVVMVISRDGKELERETIRDSSMTNDNFYADGLEWALRNGEGGYALTFSNPRVSNTFDIEDAGESGGFTVPTTTKATNAGTTAKLGIGATNASGSSDSGISPVTIGVIVGVVVIIAAGVAVLLVVKKKKK